MNKIFFYSNNQGKIREVKNLFKNISLEVLSQKDLKLKYEPEEKGKTFEENAKIKSYYGFKETQIPCFADDSGICIEALEGKPNIYSKRFIDGFNNDIECFRYIINRVNLKDNDKAYFKTSVSLTIKENYHLVFNGKVYGKISREILGDNGFGYDPIFIPTGSSKTLGEISKNKKNLISHRSIAINKLINFLTS